MNEGIRYDNGIKDLSILRYKIDQSYSNYKGA